MMGGFFILENFEGKSLSKASNLLTRVRKFTYFPSFITPELCFLYSHAGTMTGFWGSNTATQEILIIGAPLPFQLLPGNRWGKPQVFPVHLWVCVWYFWLGNAMEEPLGYFINLHGESFLFLPDKPLFGLFFVGGSLSVRDFCSVIIQLCRGACRASPLKKGPCESRCENVQNTGHCNHYGKVLSGKSGLSCKYCKPFLLTSNKTHGPRTALEKLAIES